MKPILPYNLLLLLTIAFTTASVSYNLVAKGSYASYLQYSYPTVHQQTAVTQELPEPQRVLPYRAADDGAEEEAWISQPEAGPQEEQQPAPVTSVQFPLDINTATAEQLKFIPQVGDVMSQRIVQYRAALGGYTDLEQIKDIKGIGEKTYEHLYAYLTVSHAGAQAEQQEAVVWEVLDS